MTYRQIVNEIDVSPIVQNTTDEIGGIAIKAPKGLYAYCQSEQDVLNTFGKPSSTYPEVFEAIAFCRKSPAHIFAAVHSDATYGGLDISLSGVAGFTSGRNIDTFSFDDHPALSHVFFAASPYEDDLAGKITYVSGKKFILYLYKIISTGYSLIATYNYSLIKEKDGFGKSLYYADVFKNNIYVIPKINANFTPTAYSFSGITTNFAGGSRGTDPTSADYVTAYNNFAKKSDYPIKLLMDCTGEHTVTINNIIQTYQPYAHGISCIPMGYNASDAVDYRNDLALDTSNVSLYTNWAEIKDDYNDSYAWISDIGSVGGKYALMSDVYDAESPAGIDELKGQKHGGQLTSWSYIDKEQDYTDADLKALDEAQINPIVLDDSYGRMVYGDKTLQVSLSSLSYTGTRRMYNYIIKIITTQILRKQEFRINDSQHRMTARILIEDLLLPIKSAGYLNDYYVVCDTTNNTDITMNERKFIVTVYLQPMPNSQFVILNMEYVGMNVDIQLLINGN